VFDPPGALPDGRTPEYAFLTVFFHARGGAEAGAAHVWAPARAVKRLANRGLDVTDPFAPGDALPDGVVVLETARESEVVYWLPEHRAVVAGDVLLGAGAKPRATDDPLRLCPARWLGAAATLDELKASLRPLLELPVERVLVSHGAPVLEGAHRALADVLD
jgi:glyoxylase-like metal-dependent hydrolase (beta-lactamase superfamily II)